MPDPVIFPLFYLPPINYFGALLTHKDAVLFEQYEHFPKQTFRNRATVLSPNGPLDLIVPVIKGSRLTGGAPGLHTVIKDVKISYDFDWQRLHWRTLESCYRSSAYFEFYEDELYQFYSKKHNFLLDLNMELLSWILHKMKQKIELNLTASYVQTPSDGSDYRQSFNKNLQNVQNTKKYFQVFDDRNGFVPNLSIADLLFNQGPQSLHYI